MKINARDYLFEATADPSGATPVWAQIAGLNSFDLNLADGEAETETTDFDSGGVYEGQAMQRGGSCTLSGNIVRDATTKDPDPGQAVCDQLAGEVGEASLGGFRFRHKDDTNWTQWTAWCSKANVGGGNNDKSTWGATFKKSGPAEVVAVA